MSAKLNTPLVPEGGEERSQKRQKVNLSWMFCDLSLHHSQNSKKSNAISFVVSIIRVMVNSTQTQAKLSHLRVQLHQLWLSQQLLYVSIAPLHLELASGCNPCATHVLLIRVSLAYVPSLAALRLRNWAGFVILMVYIRSALSQVV
jgi:hypothetical protein